MATLLAPASARPALWALLAFNLEIARVPEIVSQPLLGQIRLQWWRDALDEIHSGRPPRAHIGVTALAAAIRRHRIDRHLLDRMIDAREIQDLAVEPPATLQALEDYAAATSSGLLHAELRVLDADPAPAIEAASHLGIAWALIGLVRAVAFHHRAGRRYVPTELVAADAFDLSSPTVHAALRKMGDAASGHLDSARALRRSIPHTALPVLILARTATAHLGMLEASRYDPRAFVRPRPAVLDTIGLIWGRLSGRY